MSTQKPLQRFQLEKLEYSAYSPDLATKYYYLLPELKDNLGGRRFQFDNVETATNLWRNEKATDFRRSEAGNLVQRYDNCLNFWGDYVEK
jgi:hypothetical protein